MLLKRALFTMLLVFGIMAGSLGAAVAAGVPDSAPAPVLFQDDDDDATAEADDDDIQDDDADDDDDRDSRGNAAGGAVEFVDERGNPIFEITVEDTVIDWGDYSDFSRPDRGYLFVALTVTVTTVSDDEQEISDFDFMLRDEFGFLYGRSFASIDEESDSAEIGMFESDDIDAGDSITGLIVFAVPDDVQLIDVFYSPYGRLITVAELS